MLSSELLEHFERAQVLFQVKFVLSIVVLEQIPYEHLYLLLLQLSVLELSVAVLDQRYHRYHLGDQVGNIRYLVINAKIAVQNIRHQLWVSHNTIGFLCHILENILKGIVLEEHNILHREMLELLRFSFEELHE